MSKVNRQSRSFCLAFKKPSNAIDRFDSVVTHSPGSVAPWTRSIEMGTVRLDWVDRAGAAGTSPRSPSLARARPIMPSLPAAGLASPTTTPQDTEYVP